MKMNKKIVLHFDWFSGDHILDINLKSSNFQYEFVLTKYNTNMRTPVSNK